MIKISGHIVFTDQIGGYPPSIWENEEKLNYSHGKHTQIVVFIILIIQKIDAKNHCYDHPFQTGGLSKIRNMQ